MRKGNDPVSLEEIETLEILADRNLLRSLLRAEEDERAQRLVEHPPCFMGSRIGLKTLCVIPACL
jgi:hypothetical protein